MERNVNKYVNSNKKICSLNGDRSEGNGMDFKVMLGSSETLETNEHKLNAKLLKVFQILLCNSKPIQNLLSFATSTCTSPQQSLIPPIRNKAQKYFLWNSETEFLNCLCVLKHAANTCIRC